MRKFVIFYPELGFEGVVQVYVMDGEEPEDAIIREGDAIDEWVMVREI